MEDRSPASGPGTVGWMCSFVPEEIMLAAGLVPVRMQGRVDAIERADAYAFSNLCPYVKNILDSGLTGRLADVGGMVFAHSCDGMRRLHDLWRHYVASPFSYFLEVPKNDSAGAIAYFTARLDDLRRTMEDVFGTEITDSRLRQAIELTNEHRRLVAQIFSLQKTDPPRYRGITVLSALEVEQTRPKGETTELLRELAAGRGEGHGGAAGGSRVLVSGSRLDRPALVEIVEEVGGAVVAVDTCNGLRHYEGLVEDGSAPLAALARRYLQGRSCPRMPGGAARLDRMADLAREFGVAGVVYSTLRFCDYSLFEAPRVEEMSRRLGLPVLVLENDYVWADRERLRTRLEAFLEMIGNGS
jgi:benzoyl-CoA reductase/2-hydroxyglutaryl-CoA dehydratase subunit BcrC/BadD/HgdB